MKKSIKTLAKELELSGETGYFDYCIESYINGNRTQCKELFNDMKKEDQKKLITYIEDKEIKQFYFNLL